MQCLLDWIYYPLFASGKTKSTAFAHGSCSISIHIAHLHLNADVALVGVFYGIKSPL